jgi:hypothetical protein
MIMSKLLPVARITVAVLEGLSGDTAEVSDLGGRDARRVPPQAVKAFWEKVRRPVR